MQVFINLDKLKIEHDKPRSSERHYDRGANHDVAAGITAIILFVIGVGCAVWGVRVIATIDIGWVFLACSSRRSADLRCRMVALGLGFGLGLAALRSKANVIRINSNQGFKRIFKAQGV
ncbi:MAG: hypothetical protein ABSG46_06105 [Candidatus Binataceae bacterium]|jgi:hypothetical protein